MSKNVKKLCKDPLFQINLSIWLAQPHPKSEKYPLGIYPLFYNSGMTIYSIEPLLTLPPAVRLAISDNINCQDSTRPDLVLRTQGKKEFCILECKISSFGPESSTARQAKTLLLIVGSIISDVLGVSGQIEGMACYFLASSQIDQMKATLKTIAQEIREKTSIGIGVYDCFGIKPTQTDVLLEFSEEIKDCLAITESSPVKIIYLEKDTDPRPLYFIPYDPNIDQSKEEQELCRRILFERILGYVISKLGQANVPASVIFRTDELLNFATFGIYQIWENADSKKNLRKLVRQFIKYIHLSVDESLRAFINYEHGKGWIFNMNDEESHQNMLGQVCKFKPSVLNLSKPPEPDLFDHLDNE